MFVAVWRIVAALLPTMVLGIVESSIGLTHICVLMHADVFTYILLTDCVCQRCVAGLQPILSQEE